VRSFSNRVRSRGVSIGGQKPGGRKALSWPMAASWGRTSASQQQPSPPIRSNTEGSSTKKPSFVVVHVKGDIADVQEMMNAWMSWWPWILKICERMGLPPTFTIGLSLRWVSSNQRVPNPPAKMTAFDVSPGADFQRHPFRRINNHKLLPPRCRPPPRRPRQGALAIVRGNIWPSQVDLPVPLGPNKKPTDPAAVTGPSPSPDLPQLQPQFRKLRTGLQNRDPFKAPRIATGGPDLHGLLLRNEQPAESSAVGLIDSHLAAEVAEPKGAFAAAQA
jgi:hypothetical protein